MPTSYSAQDMAIALDDMRNSVAALETGHDTLRQSLGRVEALLQGISHMMIKESLPEIHQVAVLSPSDLTLDRQGRRFLVILTPTAVNNCTANIMGLQGYSFNLAAGWNVLNFPDGTVINGPSGSNQAIIIKATNWYQGGAL